MFETTIPFGEPELMRASEYRRYLDGENAAQSDAGVDSRISTLSPSLRADLMRFEKREGASFEAVEVLAACVRHNKRVTIHLQLDKRVVPLTVFARDRLVHCPIDMAELVQNHLPSLRVMHVEPALLRPPGDPVVALVGQARDHYSLPTLLWSIAMRGPRRELLPEIAGPAVYRVAPTLDHRALPASGAVLAAVRRMESHVYSLREIADFPGLDRERASRLLNALYLQAGLIVSRSHPNGLSVRWFQKS